MQFDCRRNLAWSRDFRRRSFVAAMPGGDAVSSRGDGPVFELSRRAFARDGRKSERKQTDTRRTRFDFKLFERMMSLLNTPLKRLPVTGGPCMARVEHVSRRWRLALFA